MSIIGNAVTLGGGGEPELLWTNPDPTASFAADTVVQVQGGYDGYIVEIRWSTGGGTLSEQYRQIFVPNPLIFDNYTKFYLSGTFYSAQGNTTYRQIKSMENGVFTFNAGYKPGNYGSWSVDNNYCIPNRIWGVKWTI